MTPSNLKSKYQRRVAGALTAIAGYSQRGAEEIVQEYVGEHESDNDGEYPAEPAWLRAERVLAQYRKDAHT